MDSHLSVPKDVHEGNGLVVYNWILIGLSTIAVACRVYARAFRARSFGLDDGCIVTALGIAIFDGVCTIVYTHYGIGTPINYLTPYQLSRAFKWFVIAVFVNYVNVFLVRFSIGVFLLRMLSRVHPKLRIGVYLLMTLNAVLTITIITIAALWCRPINGIWDKSIKSQCLSATLEDDANRAYASISAATDVLYVGISVCVLVKLDMDRRTKRNIVAILSLGLVICACAIGKATAIHESSSDLTVSNVPGAYWALTEANLGIVIASLPGVRQFAISVRPDVTRLLSESKLPLARLRKTSGGTDDGDTMQMDNVKNEAYIKRLSAAHCDTTVEIGAASIDSA